MNEKDKRESLYEAAACLLELSDVLEQMDLPNEALSLRMVQSLLVTKAAKKEAGWVDGLE